MAKKFSPRKSESDDCRRDSSSVHTQPPRSPAEASSKPTSDKRAVAEDHLQTAVDAQNIRNAFLERLSPACQFHLLFDHLEGLNFFAKMRDGRLLYVSQDSLSRFGMRHEWEIVGKTDWDLTPGRLAENFLRDDAIVYRTGKPLMHRVELWLNPQRMPDWYVTHKLPLFSHTGEVIGLMGVLQSYQRRKRNIEPYLAVAQAVEFVGTHYGEPITVADLAKLSNLSVRQLERRFHQAFHMSPQQFIVLTRIQFACEALRETDDGISNIALANGFSDQSAFTRQFRKQVGMTPLKYRRDAQAKLRSGSSPDALSGTSPDRAG